MSLGVSFISFWVEKRADERVDQHLVNSYVVVNLRAESSVIRQSKAILARSCEAGGSSD
jgi:hypothetical protein